jgi:release factor glutamine methyltransferase
MTQTESWTVGRLLDWTKTYLAEHGADSPRLDAEILLAEARGCQRIELYTAFHEVPPDPIRTRFRELVKRRAEGTPVAYLVGRREFFSLSFRVTPDVLIPRPETEFIVTALLDVLDDAGLRQSPLRILDVGTGSGILAVALARHLPQAQLTGCDISPEALAVARTNAESLGVASRIQWQTSDLLAEIPRQPAWDAIVSNPPYISTAEMANLDKDVLQYEPRLALEAGPTGLEIYQRLIPQAVTALRPGGWLVLETSPQLADRVAAQIEQQPDLSLLPMVKDLAGLKRVVVAQRKPLA